MARGVNSPRGLNDAILGQARVAKLDAKVEELRLTLDEFRSDVQTQLTQLSDGVRELLKRA